MKIKIKCRIAKQKTIEEKKRFIAMLKQLTPLKPKRMRYVKTGVESGSMIGACPRCDIALDDDMNFCPKCGQALK